MKKSFLDFSNTYVNLPDHFFQRIQPQRVKNPKLLKLNLNLAKSLDLRTEDSGHISINEILSGNKLPEGAEPIAMAYAGHQFGNFVPSLGDGRAILLGEVLTPKKKRFDVQLKGAGITKFSRSGDGRAPLGPVIREYIVSEAMYHLGIPTTRSLSIIKSDDFIQREEPLPCGVLTRVASSHIRIGTFEYFNFRKDIDSLKLLADYTINRHFPSIKSTKNKYQQLLIKVQSINAELVAKWMAVGFIHGVMNTDNTSISGETIDYGPCAFMDHYDANTVFSSIDTQGRYSFANQPSIIQWNLVRLAECLLPLIDENEKKSIEIAQNLLNTFSSLFKDRWLQMMKKKLGIKDQSEDDEELINNLIKWMQQKKPDFTNTFCNLMNYDHADDEEFEDDEFNNWKREWKKRVESKEYLDVMMSCNPTLIPRNYLVEEALSEAETDGKFDKFNELNEIISSPYQLKKVNIKYLETPSKTNIPYKTFCGT